MHNDSYVSQSRISVRYKQKFYHEVYRKLRDKKKPVCQAILISPPYENILEKYNLGLDTPSSGELTTS